MAEKKQSTRADRAAASSTKKPAAGKTGGKSTPPKKKNPEKVKKSNQDFAGGLSPNVLIAVLCVILFVLFLVIAINPDGALLKALKSVILGLLGEVGFYFSIPALLFLFIIQVFGRKRKTTMRSVCVIAFVFLSGSIYHLIVQKQGMAEGIKVISDLYTGGSLGTTGGVLCGGLAMAITLGLRQRDRLFDSGHCRGADAPGLHADHHSQHYQGHCGSPPGRGLGGRRGRLCGACRGSGEPHRQ